MRRFDGKVAIITGAGRGIGKAHALHLASLGAMVVVNDPGVSHDGVGRDFTAAGDTVQEIRAAGGEAVASFDSVVGGAAAIVECAIKTFGRLDILINNAGIVADGALNEVSLDAFRRVIDVHVFGTVEMIKASWPYLAASGAGRIINTSSQAMFGQAQMIAYATAKSAIFGLTRCLATEGAASGVTVNAIMPTALTRLTARATDDVLRGFLDTYFPPTAVASFVAWLAHETTKVNGEVFSVGGNGATRVVLAEADGVTVTTPSAEAWAEVTDRLLSLERLSTPSSMMEEVGAQALRIGGAAAADFQRMAQAILSGVKPDAG
jgi:NAD(P)-dependent dehydrogenase (short-subunit alcohol dehydrogenase family)